MAATPDCQASWCIRDRHSEFCRPAEDDVTELTMAFIVASIAIELTPGPNMAYLAILSLDRGRLAGLVAVAGVALGLTFLGAGAGFGLGTLIAQTPWLYEAIRWGGVLFLLWLAYEAWRDSQRPIDTDGRQEMLATYFRRGLVTNVLNPKAAIFYTAVLPNFVDPNRPVWGQSLFLTATYVAIATLIHAVVVLSADGLKPLVASVRFRGSLGAVFAVVLVAVAIWLAIGTRRT
jgi:threonine/homoserine/homoserine lactone efflux protein